MKTNNSSRTVVIRDEKIALLHRKKEGRDYYVVPGGGIEDDESIEEAAKRELWEETGLKLIKSRLWFEEDCGGGHIYYFLGEAEGEKLELLGEEKEENSETNWYNPEWIDLEDVKKLTVYPECLVKKLIEEKYLVK
jgi:8-oxo-dGTP pyrophosphatase MutT (NUDIX family)